MKEGPFVYIHIAFVLCATIYDDKRRIFCDKVTKKCRTTKFSRENNRYPCFSCSTFLFTEK